MDSDVINRILKVVEDSISASLKLYGKLNETRIEILNANKEIDQKIEWLADEVKSHNNLMMVRPCLKNTPDAMTLGNQIKNGLDQHGKILTELQKENRFLKLTIGIFTLITAILGGIGIYLKI